jgi:fatty acid synthase
VLKGQGEARTHVGKFHWNLVQATVRCLGDNGRLLEIGKYDILRGSSLSMRPLLRNIAFEGIDLDRILNDPANMQEVRRSAPS